MGRHGISDKMEIAAKGFDGAESKPECFDQLMLVSPMLWIKSLAEYVYICIRAVGRIPVPH